MTEPIPRFRTLTLEEQHSYEARHIRPSLVKCDDGNLVAYSDYAALAAENERLQGNLAGRDAMIMGRDSIIKCRDEEIQRLRKAGDFMFRTIDENITVEEYEWIADIEAAWNAAKEWRDAK